MSINDMLDFGVLEIECDGKGCKRTFEHEGFDGYRDFSGATKEARENGWIITKIDGDWCHFCSKECKESNQQ